jgi:hypothetical protein
MGKRGARKPKKVVGDPNDPEGLYCWMLRYLEALRVKNFSVTRLMRSGLTTRARRAARGAP